MASQLAGFVFTLLLAYCSAKNNTDAIDDVDVLLGISRGVARLFNSRVGPRYDTQVDTDHMIFSVDYHLSKHLIFSYTQDTLYKATIDPQRKSVAATPVKKVSFCRGFAVDWVHDILYWANCVYPLYSIMACGLDGEAEHTVLSRAFDRNVYRMEIDPYKGILFWVANGAIQSVETSGEGFNPNVADAEVALWTLALDLSLRRVYYVMDMDYSIQLRRLCSMDYNGGEKVEHFRAPQLIYVSGLGILGGKVVWVSSANFMDVLYEAPLNLTRMEDIKMLKHIDRMVGHMRVMHPSLQSRPKTDPCLDKGCTHSCVASGATTATCECPPGQALDYDGVSCHNITNDKTHPPTTEYSTYTAVSVTTEIANPTFTEDLTNSTPTEYSYTQIPSLLPNQESNSHLLYIGLCGFMTLVLVIALLVYVWRRNTKKSDRPAIVYIRQSEQVEIK